MVPVDEVRKKCANFLVLNNGLNDRQEEIDRLTDQHQLFHLVFDGKLIFPPVHKLRDVLDCGYGAASWAVEVADSYPLCRVNMAGLASPEAY